MKIIIVGGVAGGMSAATRLRRLMEDAEILVFEKGPHVSFANCGLPYYVSGEISDKDKLVVQSPEALYDRFGLDIRVESEVVEIDPDQKIVKVAGSDGIYTETYDKLILSPGAEPIVPDLKGLDQADNAFTLRNIPDLKAIMQELDQEKVQEAVVIGAGFIGLEMVENLVKRGIKVSLVEMADQVLPTLDPEMASFVEAELKDKGVNVLTGRSAQAFQAKGTRVILDDGNQIKSDLTILSVGVRPASQLAEQAGVQLGARGGIQVDRNYQTNLSDIYAVGDAILVKQELTGQESLISLASPANRQGRQVADIIAGLDHRRNRGSIGTSIVRVFELTAAATGLTEKLARESFDQLGMVHTISQDHASYYPGASPIRLKLIYNKVDGKILGAQAVGKKGVDKRIDVIATAIKGGLTVADLPELELAYAPPFGSAKDPVNIAGYVALNELEGLSETIQWYEVADYMEGGAVIIDTRNPEELARGQLAYDQILHIPLNDLRDHLDQLEKDKQYLLLCQSGLRSYQGERILKHHGFSAKNIDGGYGLYESILPEEVKK